MLCGVSISHVTSLRALFRMNGFDYSGGSLSVTLHYRTAIEKETSISAGSMPVGFQDRNKSAKVFLLDWHQRLDSMQQMEIERGLGRIQRHMLSFLLVRERRATIIDAEEIELSKVTETVAFIMHCDSTFLTLVIKILNLAFAFEKDYEDKFISTWTVEIIK